MMLITDFSVQFCESEIKAEILCSVSLISAFGTNQRKWWPSQQGELLIPQQFHTHVKVSGNNPRKRDSAGLKLYCWEEQMIPFIHQTKTCNFKDS